MRPQFPALRRAFHRGEHIAKFRRAPLGRMPSRERAEFLQTELYFLTNWYLNSEGGVAPAARVRDIIRLYRSLNGRFPAREGSAVPFDRIPHLISHCYRGLWPHLRAARTVRMTVSPEEFDARMFRDPGLRKKFSTLAAFFRGPLAPYCRFAFLHGSYATLDFAQGFSDPDVYLFLKRSVCERPARLIRLRALLLRNRHLLRAIDPMSHNGFLASHEGNLSCHSNVHMPVAVFRYARRFVGNPEIRFWVRDAATEHRQTFFYYAKIFVDAARSGRLAARARNGVFLEARFRRADDNLFQLKYFMSMGLLFPSLWLQARGIVLYKRYSFLRFQHPFLEKLSCARRLFPRSVRANRVPPALQRALGREYLREMAEMIEAMARDLERPAPAPRITGRPQPIPRATYDRVRRLLIRECARFRDCLAIYEYGTVTAPGISDLDLIVVVSDILTDLDAEKFMAVDEKIRRASAIAVGTVMVMNASFFRSLPAIDAVRLHRIFGRDVPRTELSPAERRIRERAALIDWLPERITRLLRYLVAGTLDVGEALRYLRSFTYSIEGVWRITRDPYFRSFVDEVVALRRHWQGDTDALGELLRRAVFVGYEALQSFIKTEGIRPSGKEGRLYLYGNQYLIFTGSAAKHDPYLAFAFSDRDAAIVPVSSAFLPQVAAYARGRGFIARQIGKQLVSVGPAPRMPQGAYRRFLERKLRLCTEEAEFLRRYGFPTGLFRFGFYYQHTLQKKLRPAVDRVRWREYGV